jgi:hypothetical protein
MKKNSTGVIAAGIFSAVLLLAAAALYWVESRPPASRQFRPRVERSEAVFIPRRPGTSGVNIDLPQDPPNLFSIDLGRSAYFNWSDLVDIDPLAVVKVEGNIRPNDGRYVINRVIDPGHSDAGAFLREKIGNWVYLPLKSGELNFFFNLASKQQKVDITTDLHKNPDKKELNITEGKLHAIEGLDSQWIRIH